MNANYLEKVSRRERIKRHNLKKTAVTIYTFAFNEYRMSVAEIF